MAILDPTETEPGFYSLDPEFNARFPHTEWVRLADIIIPSYQRPLEQRRVDRMLARFEPARLRQPKCIRRENGDLLCIDGQHTLTLMKDYGLAYGEVGISEGIPRDEEAMLFAEQHVDVKAPAPIHREYAAYDAYCNGSDSPEAVRANDLFEALRETGWAYDREHIKGLPDCSKRMTIGTTEGVKDVHKHYGKGGLMRTLMTIQEIWPNNARATAPNFIRAMGHVANLYALTNEMKLALRYYPLDLIEEKAKGLGGQGEKSKKMAIFIVRSVLKDFHLRLKGFLRANGKRPQ